VVEAAGVEQFHRLGIAQVTHFTKSQKRENGTFRRFEVRGGYTRQQFKQRMFWGKRVNKFLAKECLTVPRVVIARRWEPPDREANRHGRTTRPGVGSLTYRPLGYKSKPRVLRGIQRLYLLRLHVERLPGVLLSTGIKTGTFPGRQNSVESNHRPLNRGTSSSPPYLAFARHPSP